MRFNNYKIRTITHIVIIFLPIYQSKSVTMKTNTSSKLTLIITLIIIPMFVIAQPVTYVNDNINKASSANNQVELIAGNSKNINNDSIWMHYDDVENYDSWGFLTNGELYDVMAKWEPEDLSEYEDWAVTKVKFIVTNELPIIKVKIWEGTDGTEVYSQDVVQNVNTWTEVTLDEPFDFDHNQVLMVGYQVDMTMTELGGFVTATDDGPPVDGYGNLVRLNGQWLSEYNNHNLRVMLELNFEADFTAEKTNICDGDDITFINLSLGAESYLWTFEGGDPATSTLENPTVNYSIPGNYDVTLEITKDGNTLTENKQNFVKVNEVPSPIQGEQLVCDYTDADYSVILSEGSSYTWEVDKGDIISGQGTNMITVSWLGEGIGDVVCIEQTIYGCSGSSDPFEVIIDNCTGFSFNEAATPVTIKPNPANGNYLIIENITESPLDIEIIDINGRIVLHEKSASLSTKIDISKLEKGIYMITAKGFEGTRHTIKFIRN